MVLFRLRRMGAKKNPLLSYRRDRQALTAMAALSRPSAPTIRTPSLRPFTWRQIAPRTGWPMAPRPAKVRSAFCGAPSWWTRTARPSPTRRLSRPVERAPQPAPTRRWKILIRFLARSLVEQPDCVRVYTNRRGARLSSKLQAAQGDVGRVVGRNGRVANAMRPPPDVASRHADKPVILEIDWRYANQ